MRIPDKFVKDKQSDAAKRTLCQRGSVTKPHTYPTDLARSCWYCIDHSQKSNMVSRSGTNTIYLTRNIFCHKLKK